MNQLETAIEKALSVQGELKESNKAYLEFIKANFMIPVERKSNASENKDVLFLEEGGQILLPVFSSKAYLDKWAIDIKDKIEILRLSGVDLLKGIGEMVTVCLNIGSLHYKEFNPAELARMKSMVLKLFK